MVSSLGLVALRRRLLARARGERGQVLFLSGLLMVVVIGFLALVVDVGGWLKDGRKVQGSADSIVISGAVQLALGRTDAAATNIACQYAGMNYPGSTCPAQVIHTSPPCATGALSCVVVTDQAGSSPAFLSSLFDVNSATVYASAIASLFPLGQASGVVPFAVNALIAQTWQVGTSVTLTYDSDCFSSSKQRQSLCGTVPGNFGLLDLSTPSCDLACTITSGAPGLTGPGTYSGLPGNKWNQVSGSSGAVCGRSQTHLLLPVFSSALGTGSSATYTIIGFASFFMTTSSLCSGGGGTTTLNGVFEGIDWNGVPCSDPSCPSYGAFTIALTK